MPTFCTDSDIVAAYPGARDLLWRDPTTGVVEADFARVRTFVYDQIVRDLARRSVPLEVTDLDDATELRLAEIYGVLAELFAAARAVADSDYYRAEASRWRARYDSELAGPISTGYGHTAQRTCVLHRC